jgi:XXXCH domain-containing protein
MSEKVERKFSRVELADYLLNLSQQLRAGSLKIDGHTLAVPDEVGAEIHLKEKHGLTITKLSWGWTTREDVSLASSAKATREPDSFNAVKKRLGAVFGQLNRVAAQGQFPDKQTLEDFIAGSRAFAQLAHPDWQKPMRLYLDRLADFQRVAEAGQLETLLRELQNLHDSMTTCHREFK